MTLSCLPCADMEEVVSNNKVVTINNESSHTHDKDSCSPMCICNCCGCQSFVYEAIYNYNFIAVKILIDKKIPEYQSILTCNYFGSIWQPPQIA